MIIVKKKGTNMKLLLFSYKSFFEYHLFTVTNLKFIFSSTSRQFSKSKNNIVSPVHANISPFISNSTIYVN